MTESNATSDTYPFSSASSDCARQLASPIVRLCINDVRTAVLHAVTVLTEEYEMYGWNDTAALAHANELIAATARLVELIKEMANESRTI